MAEGLAARLHILLVDDDEHARQMTAAVLERAGHVVHQAHDANEGAEIWQKEQGSIDLLIADILLAGLSGIEIAREFVALKPHLRVIFISGSSRDQTVEMLGLVKGAQFLSKPFSRGALLAAVSASAEDAKQRPLSSG